MSEYNKGDRVMFDDDDCVYIIIGPHKTVGGSYWIEPENPAPKDEAFIVWPGVAHESLFHSASEAGR